MPLPQDYVERVYAGVLGKLIGVYLGRPFEGWTYQRIMDELGEIGYYVHDRLGVPLVVTDDDISGTFTFLRALPDYGNQHDLTPAQIGQTWLNYIIERRTILWWGGMGNSTEHTAYLRLKHGVAAPDSGSIARNGQVVAEQIGSQIFIDGWAMVAPGDPERAADLARRAASVSHDGEAIYGAQVLAAMEAQAFVEPNINRLLDTGVSFIPADSIIARLIHDIREWHVQDEDWRRTRERIASEYGYDKYGGNCHMVPNHALIMLGLLYGDDDFGQSLRITNTAGWDTDCNSGNLGCLLGIKNGLAGIEAGPDWRGPVADRLYLPTADGGRAITDAVTETYHVINIGRALANEPLLTPKNGARFHFELPGSVQGFQAEPRDMLTLENVIGHSTRGERSLALRYRHLAPGRVAQAATATFIPSDTSDLRTYELIASPTLYAGQTVRARIVADVDNDRAVTCTLYLQTYGAGDLPQRIDGPEKVLAAGADAELTWRIPATDGAPIFQIGLQLSATQRADGVVYLDYLTWDGTPDTTLHQPAGDGTMWRRAWVNGVDLFDNRWGEPYRIVQNEGRGLLIHGTRDWRDYRVSATITPHLIKAGGIAAYVQGMRRYYALLLCNDGKARLIKALDGDTVLAEADVPLQFGHAYDLMLQISNGSIQGWIDQRLLFDVHDQDQLLDSGGVALVCEEGRLATHAVTIQPVERTA